MTTSRKGSTLKNATTRLAAGKSSKATRRRMPAEQRRALILDVARHAFIRDGYRATTALSIAREAGVSETLVLNHFGSKEGLFREAAVEPVLARVDEIASALKLWSVDEEVSFDEVRERMAFYIRDWMEASREFGPLLALVLTEVHQMPDVVNNLLRTIRDHITDTSSNLAALCDLRPEFELRLPLQSLVLTYMTFVTAALGTVFQEDAEQWEEAVLDLLFLGFLSPAGRRKIASKRQDRR